VKNEKKSKPTYVTLALLHLTLRELLNGNYFTRNILAINNKQTSKIKFNSLFTIISGLHCFTRKSRTSIIVFSLKNKHQILSNIASNYYHMCDMFPKCILCIFFNLLTNKNHVCRKCCMTEKKT
jgi:hypothetical protein